MRGVLFSRSVRATFATLCLAPLIDGDGTESGKLSQDGSVPILVRIQFFGAIKELRSYCRRIYKLGDIIEIQKQALTLEEELGPDNTPFQASNGKDSNNSKWKQPRIVVDLNHMNDAPKLLTVKCSQHWTMTQCQEWQNRYFPSTKKKRSKPSGDETTLKGNKLEEDSKHHTGGAGKRLQGDHIGRFLISCAMSMFAQTDEERIALQDPSQWSSLDHNTMPALYERARKYLNSGNGVLDVAGGSGHVSMALGIRGVQSTVVDVRESVGKLPGKDRKIWKRALKKTNLQNKENGSESLQCQPVVPFQAYRAWFGSRPDGVEARFRHPDQETIPVCDEKSEQVARASAIVALHPDEATGEIVQMAVKRRIPVVVVPCCVFARLFPQRRIRSTTGGEDAARPVSSYNDLLQFLMSHDSSIQKTTLPFDGKNAVLWSTFKDSVV